MRNKIKTITVSIISHNQGILTDHVLKQLVKFKQVKKIILTINDIVNDNHKYFSHKKIYFIKNKFIKGFSQNHNDAFKLVKTEFFSICNPDINFINNPFVILCRDLNNKNLLAAPKIINRFGTIEDNARSFPSIINLILRRFFFQYGHYKYNNNNIYNPDWIAGMFWLIRRRDFLKMRGFSEDFFLYFEDVDFCRRIWEQGFTISINPKVIVMHDARRSSNKKIRYLILHLNSLFIYFKKYFLKKIPR